MTWGHNMPTLSLFTVSSSLVSSFPAVSPRFLPFGALAFYNYEVSAWQRTQRATVFTAGSCGAGHSE